MENGMNINKAFVKESGGSTYSVYFKTNEGERFITCFHWKDMSKLKAEEYAKVINERVRKDSFYQPI